MKQRLEYSYANVLFLYRDGKLDEEKLMKIRALQSLVHHFNERFLHNKAVPGEVEPSVQEMLAIKLNNGKLDSNFFKFFTALLVMSTLKVYPYKIFNEMIDLTKVIDLYYKDGCLDFSREELIKKYVVGQNINDTLYLDIENIKNPLIVLPKIFYNHLNIDQINGCLDAQINSYVNFPYQFQFESSRNVEKSEALIMLKV